MSDIRDQWEFAVLGDHRISHACARVAWALRASANSRGQTTIAVAGISRVTGLVPRRVRRHLNVLVKLGFLMREEYGGYTTRHGGRTARTHLRLPDLFASARPPTPLLDKRPGSPAPPSLYGRQGLSGTETGATRDREGGHQSPPNHMNHKNQGAAARATTPSGSRAAPRKIGTPADPLVLAKSMIAAPGIPYTEGDIAARSGLTLERIRELKGELVARGLKVVPID